MHHNQLLHSNVEQFRASARPFGLEPPEYIEPGRFYRFSGAGKKSTNKSAWCILFSDRLGGCFGDFSSDLFESWQVQHAKPLTVAERNDFQKKLNDIKEKNRHELEEKQLKAQQEAAEIWRSAIPAENDHPYLLKKGIKSYGLRVYHGEKIIGEMACDGALIIPIRHGKELNSLQFISPSGEKRFLSGGKKSGCYFSIGKPDQTKPWCIAEGYATAASIFEATAYPVAVAFDAGNLEGVARYLHQRFPDKQFIVCADDDYRSEDNVGLTKAKIAAKVVGAKLVVPEFGDDRPEWATDFNDLHQIKTLEAVRVCVNASLPQKKQRSLTCDYGGGRFEVSASGVFFIGPDKDGNVLPPRWICSPLFVVAKTRDAKSGEWGRLLEWHDDDQIKHQWAMPLELLQGDASDVRRELARLGLTISPGKASRDLLASFLQVCPIEARARCVDRLGWHGAVYVTASESIGQDDEMVVFQNAHAIEPALSVAGTVGAWRDTIGRLASGNSRLVFALSVAFAPSLAAIVGEDSGGFHFRGASSSGKTTALRVAASVWGEPVAYSRLWRATANGLEGLAALHNDGLLILDELSQIDPKEAGEAAYLLANGQGKTRASRSGAARQAARWCLLFLSAGEESLTALMARAGQKANAGQEIRLADIEADAGVGMGAFEVLHDQPSPAALALKLKDLASRYHGAVGGAWLRQVVNNRSQLADLITDGIRQFVDEFIPNGVSGQVLRVARRFALVAVAGELATHYGLTGWSNGESINAAQKCFAIWLESFGSIGNREDRAILSQVRAFFEAFGASRFDDMKMPNNERIHNRAGFFRTGVNDDREYMVLTEIFKQEICQGFDPKVVIRVLVNAGWIEPGNDGKTSQKPRITGVGTPRCYVFTGRMWEGE